MKTNSIFYRLSMVRIRFDHCPICHRRGFETIDTGESKFVCCQLRVRVKSGTHEVIFSVHGVEMSEEEFERFVKLKSFQ